MCLIVYSNDHAPLTVRLIYSSSKLRTVQMMIFSLVAMIGLAKCCITSACLQWLCHSGERIVARGPLVIQNFLSDRTFNVRIGNTLSDIFKQEQGVPQGSILSPTLFGIKINDIVKCVKDLDCSLFVDDFGIFIRSKNMETIEFKLQ